MSLNIVYAYEELAVGDVPVKLSSALVEADVPGRKEARIMVAGGAICFLYDGNDPTADTVNYLGPGDTLRLDSLDKMRNFTAVRQGSDNPKLAINYERWAYGK